MLHPVLVLGLQLFGFKEIAVYVLVSVAILAVAVYARRAAALSALLCLTLLVTPDRPATATARPTAATAGMPARDVQLPPAARACHANPIVCENRQRGSTHWQIGQSPYIMADDTHQQIKGYASATSVDKGGTIAFSVSVTPTQTYTMDIYRMGWYGGAGGRLMQHLGSLPGTQQPPCPTDPPTGLIACTWAPSYTLAVPSTWTSGIYLVLLTNAQHYQNYIVFVVRDDRRKADFLYQQSVTTYQAYNNYPDDGATGKSLYDDQSKGAATVPGSARAVKVSFDRPYADSGAGDFLKWDINLVRWLERRGYDVTYATDIDTDRNGARLLRYRGFFSAGHDEYYSQNMYNAVQAARDHGVNLAFFGANAIAWQIRLEPSAGGVPDRVEVCYKDAALDPVHGATTTVQWRDPRLGRPQQALIGLDTEGPVYQDRNVPYEVTNNGHWVYTRTGFTDGARVANLVGYEVDNQKTPRYPLPPSQPGTYALLSSSPFTQKDGTHPDTANSSIYQAPSGAWVFAAGTMSWSWGLDNYGHNAANPGIQTATANILDTFRDGGTPPPNGLTATAISRSQIDLSWSDNARNARGYVVWRSPNGRTNWTRVATLPATSTSYTDRGLAMDTRYYRVTATAAHGSSPPSNTAASAPTTRSTSVLFSTNFDGQGAGPLATGPGPHHFSGMVGRARLVVQRTIAASVPQALAIRLAGGGSVCAYKQYGRGYTEHDLTFRLRLGRDVTLSGGSYVILAQAGPNSTSKKGQVSIILPSRRTIRVDYYDSTGAAHSLYGTGYVLRRGSWHTIELRERVGVGTGSLTLLVSGTTVVAGTRLDTGSHAIGRLAVGEVFANSAAVTGHLYVDDVTATTTRPVHTTGRRRWT